MVTTAYFAAAAACFDQRVSCAACASHPIGSDRLNQKPPSHSESSRGIPRLLLTIVDLPRLKLSLSSQRPIIVHLQTKARQANLGLSRMTGPDCPFHRAWCQRPPCRHSTQWIHPAFSAAFASITNAGQKIRSESCRCVPAVDKFRATKHGFRSLQPSSVGSRDGVAFIPD